MATNNIGRPRSKELEDLGFDILKYNNKYNAICRVCKKALQNTAVARLKGHRKVCGERHPADIIADLHLINAPQEELNVTRNNSTEKLPETEEIAAQLNVEMKTEIFSDESPYRLRNSSTLNDTVPKRTLKRPASPNSKNIIEGTIQKLAKLCEDSRKKEEPVHEFDVFCKSLAIQLKNMPVREALICQEKLQGVMTNHRLYILSENGSATFTDKLFTSTPSPSQTTSSSKLLK